ncbi:MAG TPA: hypothetical protein VMT52_18965 [Planctomycetota bacterium]|nr:hypothetical protein [Planctomycetota bacterium]
MLILTSVLSIALGLTDFVGDGDVDRSVQTEAHRAFQRLSEVLRKSGWVTEGDVTHPRVLAGGTELEFRCLADLDMNGYAFDGSTGDLEWNPTVYTVRLDESDGSLGIHVGPNRALLLGRHVTSIEFKTSAEDGSLYPQEVQVSLTTQRTDSQKDPIKYAFTGSIHMRN